MILYQEGAVKAMAEAAGARMRHVKPHGALYNTAATDYDMSMNIVLAMKDLDPSLVLVGQSGSQLISAARNTGSRESSSPLSRYRLYPRRQRKTVLFFISKSSFHPDYKNQMAL